jgi:hypothetical protein
MPKRKKNTMSDEKIIEKEQLTGTGIYVNSGQIEASDYDITDWVTLQKDYYKMRVSDPLISTTIDIIKYPIMMSEYRIETPNKEVAEYIRFVFDNIKGGFKNFKYHKLLALDFGLSMHEMIVKRADYWKGKLTNRPIAFNPIQNETIQEFHFDDQVDFIGIKHNRRIPQKGQFPIDIEVDSLDYFSYNQIYNDIRGTALYRPDRFFWDCKHKVITAKTNATIRGAGFIGIGYNGEPSDADKGKIETIGRSIAAAKNAYFSYNKEKISVDILELKNQADVIPFLDYLDRQLFFNTLSQFLTAGIGQNGSRAAAGELKSPYELFSSYTLESLQENFQLLVDRIIDMSWAANIPEEEWPVFKFNSIRAIDLIKVANYTKALYDTSILTKQPEDEKYLREIFGMPELTAQAAIINPTIPALSKKLNKRNLSSDLIEFENRVFSTDSATEHYETMSEKIKLSMVKITRILFDDIREQLKAGKDVDIAIKQRVISQALTIAMRLYDEGFNRGSKDIKDEVKKLSTSTALALDKKIYSSKMKVVERSLKNYFFKVKNVVEGNLGKISDNYIKKVGGLDEYIMGFETGFAGEKGAIQTELENSYVDGRGETLLDLADNIDTYYYSTSMDNSLCDECAPFDGQIMTKDEIESEGLNFTSPINPFCLGKYHDPNTCRCQIVAYSVKG